ncbi:hypothetical protein BLNAU_23104 [Blattamonas nauphoetae]|uniref:Uncharacterized protein n=1 Tax=Blattamonas nauphoetae TaxID=2049346 RepID=A0ABQ9WU88_9EUKA|nr:hypothetical protein BLNAU_23104 [Blattamonas nauphoetae]
MLGTIIFVLCELSHAANIQDLVDAFSGNSHVFVLSETEYDGEDVELKHSNVCFIGQDHSITVQPKVASNSLFVVLEMSHSLENVSMSMNGASSFVFVSSDSSFEFVDCDWADDRVTSPIAVVAGGTVGFTGFNMESTVVETSLVDSASAGTTVNISASHYKNVVVGSTSPLLCTASTRFVTIASSSFESVTYVPTSSNEETDNTADGDKQMKETNELVSVTIKASSFENCEGAIEFTIVPALSATGVEISSSSFDHCGLAKTLPEYVTNGPQTIRISSSSFDHQNVPVNGQAGFLTFDSEDGELEIASTSFRTFSTTNGSGVLYFKKGSKLTIQDSTFSTVTSIGAGWSCVVIEAMPQNLAINKTFFRNCRSEGKAGAIVVGGGGRKRRWKGGTAKRMRCRRHASLTYFDADSFGEMSSFSSSPQVLDASGTRYELPVKISRLLKRFVWSFVAFGVVVLVVVAGSVMCCVGICCCVCCPCCFGACCCRRTRKCCRSGRAVPKQFAE